MWLLAFQRNKNESKIPWYCFFKEATFFRMQQYEEPYDIIKIQNGSAQEIQTKK